MNVILLERLANLGDLGDEVSVRGGFARNFLIPQGKAVQANDTNRQVFEERRQELEAAAQAKLSVCRAARCTARGHGADHRGQGR